MHPPEYPGLFHELRCVDPERCGCLLYQGFQKTAKKSHQHEMMCRQHEVVRVLHSRVSNIDHIRIRLVSCDLAPRCLKLVYTRTIRLAGFRICPDPAPALGRVWPPAMYIRLPFATVTLCSTPPGRLLQGVCATRVVPGTGSGFFSHDQRRRPTAYCVVPWEDMPTESKVSPCTAA